MEQRRRWGSTVLAASLLSEMPALAHNNNGTKISEVGNLNEDKCRLTAIFDVNLGTCPAVAFDAPALNHMVLAEAPRYLDS